MQCVVNLFAIKRHAVGIAAAASSFACYAVLHATRFCMLCSLNTAGKKQFLSFACAERALLYLHIQILPLFLLACPTSVLFRQVCVACIAELARPSTNALLSSFAVAAYLLEQVHMACQ